ncbi:MAG: hypothetical protein H2045_07860 [Rhizobiales bacterium]|nr:hypothetical protein [Hyphomicrobiales bacterium]
MTSIRAKAPAVDGSGCDLRAALPKYIPQYIGVLSKTSAMIDPGIEKFSERRGVKIALFLKMQAFV